MLRYQVFGLHQSDPILVPQSYWRKKEKDDLRGPFLQRNGTSGSSPTGAKNRVPRREVGVSVCNEDTSVEKESEGERERKKVKIPRKTNITRVDLLESIKRIKFQSPNRWN